MLVELIFCFKWIIFNIDLLLPSSFHFSFIFQKSPTDKHLFRQEAPNKMAAEKQLKITWRHKNVPKQKKT